MSKPPVHKMAWSLLLLTGVGMLAWALVRADDEAPANKKQALPADLQRISADAGGFVSVRLADLWDHDLVKPTREKMGDELTRAEKQFGAGLGVNLSGPFHK